MKVYIVMSSYCLEPWEIYDVFGDDEDAEELLDQLRSDEDLIYYDYKIVEHKVK